MRSRPTVLQPEDADDEEAKQLLKDAKDGWYGDAASFGTMAHCPSIFKALVSVLDSFGQGENIDTELLELVRLKIAEAHQCAYCTTVRTLDVQSEIEPKEEAIFGDISEERLTNREYLAVTLATYLSEDPHRIRESFFEELREEFTERELVELLLFTSLEVGLDRFCIALELQPTSDSVYPDEIEYPRKDPNYAPE